MECTTPASETHPTALLLELPLYLLYRIVDQLDLQDQRHLFMTCSRLNGKWQLHFSHLVGDWERHLYTPKIKLLSVVLAQQQGCKGKVCKWLGDCLYGTDRQCFVRAEIGGAVLCLRLH